MGGTNQGGDYAGGVGLPSYGGTEQGSGITGPGDSDPGFGGTNQGEGITGGTNQDG
jgi:hypothetical protein